MALTDEDKTWINEKLEGMETRLLIAALEMEVGNLIERVKKLEGNKAS